MVLVTIGNRFKIEASSAFALSVKMRDRTDYGKGAEAAHHRVSTRKPTKGATWSNAPLTG